MNKIREHFQVDVDYSGTLDFDEFSNLTADIKHERDPYKDLSYCWGVLGTSKRMLININRFKFHVQDPSGRGKLKVGTIKDQIMENNGAGICKSDVKEMFLNVDDHDYIDMFHFISAVTNSKVKNVDKTDVD